MIAARPVDVNLPPRVVAVARFEQLFRRAAGTEVDKTDLRRHSDFVNRKLHDLSVVSVPYVKALEAQLTAIVGGRAWRWRALFQIVDPKLRNPSTEH